jgi:DNA-binding MarR family transcriptional regulator
MNLDDLNLAVTAFASHHANPTHVSMHHFLLFLYVARFGGRCTYRQLENGLALENSSVSRTVNALGAEHRNGKPGLGLLTTYNDPDEGRRFIVTFTPRGAALLRHLQAI